MRRKRRKVTKTLIRQRIEEVESDLDFVNKLGVTVENFPEGSPSGCQRTPAEVRNDEIKVLQGKLKALKNRMAGLS